MLESQNNFIVQQAQTGRYKVKLGFLRLYYIVTRNHFNKSFTRRKYFSFSKHNFHLGAERRKIIKISSKNPVNSCLVSWHDEAALSPAHILILIVDN